MLLSDGYAAYESFAKKVELVHAQCWAHARREIFESQAADPQGAHEALGRVELPAHLRHEAAAYHVHPALLDACFQVLLEATPSEDRPTDRMFLPERISRVYFHRSPGARAG